MLRDFALELSLRARPHLARLLRYLRADARDSRSEDTAEAEIYRAILTSQFPDERERAAFQRVWDVGCRNWSYASTLAAHFPQAQLIGVEVDPDRLYGNFSTRRSAANAEARRLLEQGREVRLELKDFRSCDVIAGRRPSLICHFFPYVSESPCRSGGLPARFANFAGLLEASQRHSPATLLSCHQGEWEAAVARTAYQRTGLMLSAEHELPQNPLWDFPYPIIVLRAST